MTAPESPVLEKRSIFLRLYHGETAFRFVPRARVWFALSLSVIVIGLLGLGLRGLNLGIDFTGGNQWVVPAGETSVADAEDAVEALGFAEVKVQEVGDNLRIQTPVIEGEGDERQARVEEVTQVLLDLTGAADDEIVITDVGPRWGQEISRKALNALVVFLVLIAVYITIRFEFRMAVATLGALVHDILVVVGVYAVFQLPVTPATVVAILTILGFSIYDGIVVFDRVDENTRLLTSGARMTYSDMVDLSLNQVLMRSLNTQITALLPIISVLLVGSLALGATTLQEFGLALFVGQMAGAYSSLFIASPLLAILKEREPRYRTLRQRLAERAPADRPAPPAGVAAAPGVLGAPAPTRLGPAPLPAVRGHPPRPRKKGKRR